MPTLSTGRPPYAIEFDHLTKRYGRHAVVDDLFIHCSARARHGLPGPERIREVDDDEGLARTGFGQRGPGNHRGSDLATCPTPPARSGSSSNKTHSTRGGAVATTSRSSPTSRESRPDE